MIARIIVRGGVVGVGLEGVSEREGERGGEGVCLDVT